MEKKVSVIIPVYNVKPEYIRDAIDSVLNQTYKNIEIIVVNDGSTNSETLEYLKTIQNDKIQVINQENKGLGGARNTGIDNSTGDYLGFLDSDDWLENNFYETLINLCEKNDADMACGTLTRVTPQKQKNMDDFKNVVRSDFVKKMEFITNGSVCSKLFKKSFWGNTRFTEHRYYEDNPVLLKLLFESNKVAFTNKVRYLYRENQESICLNPDSDKMLKRVNDGLFMLRQIYDLPYSKKTEKDVAMKTFIPILINFGAYCNNFTYKNDVLNLLGEEYKGYLSMPTKNNFIENIFSIKNSARKTHKIITILGIKIKIKRKPKNRAK